jgi:hypothetical protein
VEANTEVRRQEASLMMRKNDGSLVRIEGRWYLRVVRPQQSVAENRRQQRVVRHEQIKLRETEERRRIREQEARLRYTKDAPFLQLD